MTRVSEHIVKDRQYYKFCLYGFLKNLRFFEPFLIIFFLQKGLSYLEIGSLYAIREVGINIFEIPSGVVADALGRRRTLATTFLIYILAFILFYLGEDYGLFASAMLLYALADAMRSGINKALIVSYLEKTGQSHLRITYYGHTRSWSQMGSAVSSLLAGILVFFNEQLNFIFLFSIIPYVLDFLNVLSYPAWLDKVAGSSGNYRAKLLATGKTFVNTLKSPALLRALTNASLYGGFYKSLKDFIQPYIKASVIALPVALAWTEHQKMSVMLGVTYFIMFLGSSIASRQAGRVTGRIGSATTLLNITLLAGGVLGLVSGWLMAYLQLPLTVITLFIILLILENLRKPAAVAEITLIGQREVHASVLSVQSQLASLFTAVLALLIGWLADKLGLGYGIMAAAASVLLAYPFIYLSNRKESNHL